MKDRFFGNTKSVFPQMIGEYLAKYIVINQNSAENEMHIA